MLPSNHREGEGVKLDRAARWAEILANIAESVDLE
jgi:hypothetical protein